MLLTRQNAIAGGGKFIIFIYVRKILSKRTDVKKRARKFKFFSKPKIRFLVSLSLDGEKTSLKLGEAWAEKGVQSKRHRPTTTSWRNKCNFEDNEHKKRPLDIINFRYFIFFHTRKFFPVYREQQKKSPEADALKPDNGQWKAVSE